MRSSFSLILFFLLFGCGLKTKPRLPEGTRTQSLHERYIKKYTKKKPEDKTTDKKEKQ